MNKKIVIAALLGVVVEAMTGIGSKTLQKIGLKSA